MISDYLYRNPRILMLLVAIIAISGWVAIQLQPRLEDPVLSKRVGVITAVYPGADALQVESQLADLMEESLQDIAEINEVSTTCRAGIISLAVELSDRVAAVEPVWSRVRDRLADLERELPEAVAKPALHVLELKAFAEIIALSWHGDDPPNLILLRRLAKELKSRLEEISGTEKVELFGDPGEEMLVEVSPSVLAVMETSTGAIAQQISASQSRQPAGYVRAQDSQLLLDVTGADAANRVGETLIQYGQGSQARLADIADITKGAVSNPSQLAEVDGRRAVVVAAFVRDQSRVDLWARELAAVLDGFRSELPGDIHAKSIFSQLRYIDQRLRLLMWNMLQSGAAVVLVILVLMGWRATLVVALALPLSALMVLSGMRALGIPIHQISITGLIIALGLLIDNAIVIVDEVRSRILLGLPPLRAMRQAVSHVAMPLFGSTLTTTLAFVPIATLPGPPGEFVGTMAVSVILAINASFILAMTVVPALTALTVRGKSQPGWLSRGVSNRMISAAYAWSLELFLRRPLLGGAVTVVLPVLGFWLASTLPEQFFPPSDRNQIQIEIELPAQASLEETAERAESVREIVVAQDAVTHVNWFLGASAPTFYYNVVPRRRETPFYGQALVDLLPGTDTRKVVRQIQQDLDAGFPDCRIIVRQLEQGPPFDAPVELRLFGPDLGELSRLGSQLRLSLSQTPNVIHTRSDLEETTLKLTLHVVERETLAAGLRRQQIAGQLYTLLEGVSAGLIPIGSDEVPVRVRSSGVDRMDLAELASLQLLPAMRGPNPGPSSMSPAASGPPPGIGIAPEQAQLPLSAIAEFELESDVGSVQRINGRRVNEVKAYLVAGTLPSTVVKAFETGLEQTGFELPAGYTLKLGGESEERDQAVRNLLANAAVLFVLIALTLVVSFRSFRMAGIIVAVGVLSAGLGPGALWLFAYPFGFMAIVGTMGLIGVAINDSIVVAAGIQERSQSRDGDLHEIKEVIMHRTRHVIATTLTTIVGFVPLVLGGGQFWPPLAITIAGGVSGATFLALYFVPCAYLLVCGRRRAGGLNASG